MPDLIPEGSLRAYIERIAEIGLPVETVFFAEETDGMTDFERGHIDPIYCIGEEPNRLWFINTEQRRMISLANTPRPH